MLGGRLGRGVSKGGNQGGGRAARPCAPSWPADLHHFPGGRGSRRRSRRRQFTISELQRDGAGRAVARPEETREAKRRAQAPTVTTVVTGVASPRRRPLTAHRPDGLLVHDVLLMSASRRAGARELPLASPTALTASADADDWCARRTAPRRGRPTPSPGSRGCAASRGTGHGRPPSSLRGQACQRTASPRAASLCGRARPRALKR